MSLVLPTRRSFIAGLASFVAAPAIVRASSLMPVSSKFIEASVADVAEYAGPVWAELADITRRAFVPRLYVQMYKSTPILQHPGMAGLLQQSTVRVATP